MGGLLIQIAHNSEPRFSISHPFGEGAGLVRPAILDVGLGRVYGIAACRSRGLEQVFSNTVTR